MLGIAVRSLIVAAGILAIGLGLLTAASVDRFAGLWIAAVGGFLVLATLLEKRRYRSAAAELAGDVIGPGGGEPEGSRLEPRFRPTAEVFVDPTTGRRMRVLLDSGSGERRYVAED